MEQERCRGRLNDGVNNSGSSGECAGLLVERVKKTRGTREMWRKIK